MIYLDNASTTYYKPKQVIRAVNDAMNGIATYGRSTSFVALDASRIVYNCREEIAELFNCENIENVVFTNNATTALNIAIHGLINNQDHVITTVMEHNSVLRPLYKTGCELSFLSIDDTYTINPEHIKSLIKENTKALVCTHASNLTGQINDVIKVGEICKANNILFILDIAQSAGCINVDMQKFNASVICFTGHKGLLSPQGTGGLCIANHIDIKSFIVGGSGINTFDKTHPVKLPAALEAGTLNCHGISGLLAGVKYIKEEKVANIFKHENMLAQRLYKGIYKIPNVIVYGNYEIEKLAIVAMNIKGIESNVLSDTLQQNYQICTRSGGHCAPLMHETLNTTKQGIVRFSFSYNNTVDEVDKVIEVIKQLAIQAL